VDKEHLMPLSDKAPTQINEADLLGLISNQEGEGKSIDYKRDPVGHADKDKKEFLYDASSFANTQGGYLVFGMEEASGMPTKIAGFANIDPDQEILRLEQMLRDGIRPPISGVETAAVPVTGGNIAIVMRIPKSWNPPHQVTFQKAFRFYARDSNGKYQIDVDELRSVFEISATVAERIREFRAERSGRIANGDTPVVLLGGGNLVLHVVPFSAFNFGSTFPLHEVARDPDKFPTLLDSHARRHQITFDGLTVTSNADAPPTPQRAYTQVFRMGAVEAVGSSLARGQDSRWLILPHLEAIIIRYAKVYMQALHRFGVEPPIAILASLLNVGGLRFVQDFIPRGALTEDMPSTLLTRRQFHFVESIFDQVPFDDKTTAKGLRLTLDHLANAAGLPTSPYFDAAGNYTLTI
jgi:hypothetical protein